MLLPNMASSALAVRSTGLRHEAKGSVASRMACSVARPSSAIRSTTPRGRLST